MSDMQTSVRFSMFTPSGNEAVKAMCDGLIARIQAGELRRNDLEKAIVEGQTVLCKTPRPEGDTTSWGEVITGTYNEVHDTEPEWAICDYLNPVVEAQGWKPVSRWDW